MSKLIIKADSGIIFDTTHRYIGKKKNFGKGVWFKDTNNDGKWNKGESLITPGNRIRNNDFSYSQLNSDGTVTKLTDKNGNVTKGLENKVSDADKYAFKHKLVYGRVASYNDKTKKWERNNNNPIQWDIDTKRNKDYDNTDIYNNSYARTKRNGHIFNTISVFDKDGNPTISEYLVPKYNVIFKFDKNNVITPESGNLADKLLNIKPKDEAAQIAVPQNTGVSSTFWDLNPDGGSYTRGNTKLTYGQIDDGEGLNGSGYNDIDDAYREAWLAVNPQARAHGKWFWGHQFWRTDRALDIKDDYVKQYESDLNKWLQHHYAINPDQNKAVLNADHKYLRKFVQKNDKDIDTNYVPLFTGNQWGFGVREGMDANGNTIYTDYNGDEIPGLIFKDGKPYIPADTPKNYFKQGGKLIKRQKYGIQRKFN